jgi:site-specific DNA-methyltransferase (adenine-specific)
MAWKRRDNMLSPKYEGENYRLWVGDALKVLSSFPDNCVHLIVTSPPYYIRAGYYSDLPDDLENQPSWEEYVAKLLDILSECARVLVAGGRICVNIADSWTGWKEGGVNRCRPTHARVILHLVERCGLLYAGSIIYEQIRAHHNSGRALFVSGSFPYPPHIPICTFYEYILIFQKEGKYQPADNSPENREASKISKWEFTNWASTGIWRVPANRERKICPAPFPLEIPYRLIKLFSFRGDIVLDPFVGSGTTVYAAIQLGRVAWGIDINETYIDYVYQNIPFASVNLFS